MSVLVGNMKHWTIIIILQYNVVICGVLELSISNPFQRRALAPHLHAYLLRGGWRGALAAKHVRDHQCGQSIKCVSPVAISTAISIKTILHVNKISREKISLIYL